MDLSKFDSLTDLFFYQASKQNPENIFLEWLNPKNKKKFTWSETSLNIYKIAKIINSFNSIYSWWAKRDANSHSIATIGF